jgi:predicted nucleic acid-binding protein
LGLIVLDTNVVSEMMRPIPDATVKQWLNAQVTEELWLNSIIVAELFFGVARMPEGVRKQRFTQASKEIVEQNFAGRILSFDLEAAAAYAEISARCMAKGHPIDMADAQIAAICWVQDAQLATRNTKHFEGLGLSLINPWY